MASTAVRFDEILRVLWQHDVDFIVVGGIAAKEQANRPKDRSQLPFLRQLLAESRRPGSG